MQQVPFTWFGKGKNLFYELHSALVTDGKSHHVGVYIKTNKGHNQAVDLLLLM
jgi:hypothetical protein